MQLVGLILSIVYLVDQRPKMNEIKKESSYFFPWLATAAIASAATVGSKYSPHFFIGLKSFHLIDKAMEFLLADLIEQCLHHLCFLSV